MIDVNSSPHAGEQDNLGAEAVVGWRPIETAPKDGSWVFLAGGACWGDEGDNNGRAVSGQYSDYLNGRATEWHWQFAWYDGGYYGVYENPTHWMPIPALPTTARPPT